MIRIIRAHSALALTISLWPAVALAFQLDGGTISGSKSPTQVKIQDPGWPRTFEKDKATVVLYQPQIDSWTDYSTLKFRCAMSVTPKHKKEPDFGVLTVSASTFVDHDSRSVLLTDIEAEAKFPNLSAHESKKLAEVAREVLPKKSYLTVSLDRILACMNSDQVKVPRVELNLLPPPIYHSRVPAIMVIFMGQPQFKPVKDTRLMCAINTNWDVFMDLNDSKYFLLDGQSWLMAPDPINGPWTPAVTVPADLSKLPNDKNWESVKKNVPGQPFSIVPKVFTSTTPAELIATDGDAVYTPLDNCGLMYVSNPTQPIFMNESDSSIYFLVAGRWFRSMSLDGPWSAASSNLPANFKKIPATSPVGYVLASIPGTEEADDAILLASVPHKATINRATAKVDVTYDGKPQFETVTGTSMQYAVNTPYSVISANGKYYCCQQAVWFVASTPMGPWAVATSVPQVIYTIPPSNPLYNVTYVQVYNSTPTTVVCGYTEGYSGEYVAATGALMFGAGMITGAALAGSSSYCCYHYGACYCSYGCAATYHYGYGGYYRGASYYGPYGGAGHYAGYNSATGAFSRGAYAYGPEGAAGVHQAYNPWTNTYRSHEGATNGYDSWGHSTVSRGDQWASAGHVSTPDGSAGYVHGSGGNTAVKTPNNAYADHDGNVYKREGAGDWQQVNKSGGWDSAAHNNNWNSGLQNEMNHSYDNRSWSNQLDNRWGGFNDNRWGGGGGFGGDRFGGGGFGGGGGGFDRGRWGGGGFGGGFHGFRR